MIRLSTRPETLRSDGTLTVERVGECLGDYRCRVYGTVMTGVGPHGGCRLEMGGKEEPATMQIGDTPPIEIEMGEHDGSLRGVARAIGHPFRAEALEEAEGMLEAVS